MFSSILEAVFKYIKQGFKVFPVKPDKKPHTIHGLKDATQSKEVVLQFWKRWPNAGIGLVTDGFIVLDFDKKSGGAESKLAIEAKYGPLPKTRTHRTGGGGLHYIYRNSDGIDIRNTVNLGGYKGVDLRANGGYVVAPPSLHKSGNKYEVVDDSDIAPAPEWLIKLATERKTFAPKVATSDEPEIVEGQRNSSLTSMAGSMRSSGFSQESIAAALLKENVEKCHPPLPEDEIRSIAKSIAQYESGYNGKKGRKGVTIATQIVELANDVDFFHSLESIPYAKILQTDRKEVWPLESRRFKDFLSKRFYEKEGKALSSQAIQDALNTLRGKALFEGPEEPVYKRLAGYMGDIYLDLCNPDWSVVKITSEGWEVVQDSPIHFVRSRGMTALPAPQVGGDINTLKKFLNIDAKEWLLLVAWIIGALIPDGPFPILIITGDQGSAKSTIARIIRSLIDPSTTPLRSLPKDIRDLSISASNSWVLVYDNVSYISVWLSDAICRLATGGGFATRELYSDSDEALFTATRPIMLNGIGDIANRSDMLDRAIIVTLPAIPDEKRRTEKDIWGEFEVLRPTIIAALLDGISLVLKNRDSVKLDKMPRMADFVQCVVAAMPAFGVDPKDFMEIYEWNIQSINQLALESSPVAKEIMILAGNLPKGDEWSSTATDLLDPLRYEVDDSIQKRRDWPKSPKALSSVLSRLTPNLRARGVEIIKERGTERRIRIFKNTNNFVKPTKIKERAIVKPNGKGGLLISIVRTKEN